MPTFNLLRNSRVFFTTNVNPNTGAIYLASETAISSANTVELQVLDGFSFSQGTQQQTIQISEAGNTPVRGQRAFNTQLDPVEFSFSTYLRPKLSGSIVTAEEKVLWNALFSSVAFDPTGLVLSTTTLTRASTTTNVATLVCAAANLTGANIAVGDWVSVAGLPAGVTNVQEWAQPAKITAVSPNATAATSITLAYASAPSAAATTAATGATSVTLFKGAWATTQVSSVSKAALAYAHAAGSNKNQLQKFGMYFFVDNILYGIDNCALDQASIDFGLDGIAMVTWTGKGTYLRQLNAGANTATVSSANPAVFSGTGNSTGTAAAKTTDAQYITNKLSTMSLEGNIMGGGTTYTVALTGGNLTIANNINYVIPANLGVVNQPVGYFTGTRSISGSVNAYLRTGTGNSAQVLNDILSNITTAAETKFKMQIEVGGSSNATRVEFKINGAMLQVPTIESADVMSTTINFNAQGYDPILANASYDLEQTNDLQITYFSA